MNFSKKALLGSLIAIFLAIICVGLTIIPYWWLGEHCPASLLDAKHYENNWPQNRPVCGKYQENQASSQCYPASEKLLSKDIIGSEIQQKDGPNRGHDAGKEPSDWQYTFLCEVKITDLILASFTVLIALFTLGLGIATFLLWVSTEKLWEGSREDFISTHRPILRIRCVVIQPPNPSKQSPLFEGEPVHGELQIVNIGNSAATIVQAGCWVEWVEKGLPMRAPYYGKPANLPIRFRMERGSTVLVPFASESVVSKQLVNFGHPQAKWHCYVMGYIEYIDKLNFLRRTAFCREFRLSEIGVNNLAGRFFAVDDPDYEYED